MLLVYYNINYYIVYLVKLLAICPTGILVICIFENLSSSEFVLLRIVFDTTSRSMEIYILVFRITGNYRIINQSKQNLYTNKYQENCLDLFLKLIGKVL